MASIKGGISTKLFVGNLPPMCQNEDLFALFGQYGTVAECDIVKDYAFVHFNDAAEAKIAVDALDGTDLHGNKLRVQLSNSRVRQRPGMGDKETCYRCGGTGHWSKDCPSHAGSRDYPRRSAPPRSSRGSSRSSGSGGGYRAYDDYYPQERSLPRVPVARYNPYERRLPPIPSTSALAYLRPAASDPYARAAEYYNAKVGDPYYDLAYDNLRGGGASRY